MSKVTDEQIIEAMGGPLEQWALNCHAASIALVKSRLFPVARVARGACIGVGGQHSWVVLGDDVYSPDAKIVDPTLWSYDDRVKGIWRGTARAGRHTPHGAGSIMDYGKPTSTGGETIRLTPTFEMGPAAKAFLGLLGPLDRRGWSALAHAPVEGWPSKQIIAAMVDTPAVAALVPIDIVGMITDRNPNGLYLAGDEETS